MSKPKYIEDLSLDIQDKYFDDAKDLNSMRFLFEKFGGTVISLVVECLRGGDGFDHRFMGFVEALLVETKKSQECLDSKIDHIDNAFHKHYGVLRDE